MSADLDMAPKFPTETFEAIIDQVYSLEEKDSNVAKLLGVFSLVSKSWLPRSRHYLFQRLTIRRDATMTKRFLDLLDSPLCSVKRYVRILELDILSWLRDALPQFSVLLPEVQELRINNGIFHTLSPKVLSDFANLQILMLDDCYFEPSAHLFETLSMCTSLQRICFHCVWIIRPSHSDSSSAVPPPTSLRSIRIKSKAGNTIHSSDTIEWLMSGEQVPAIETLDLTITQTDDTRAIGHGLRRLGPCLKNLEVQFIFDGATQNEFSRNVDLGYNTNLNSICLRFGPASVASLLARVTSSEVRDVVADVASGPASVEELDEVDWDSVAKILNQPNFSKLERLIIPAGCFLGDVDTVRQWMMQRLLPGRARDKLVLCEQWFGNCL